MTPTVYAFDRSVGEQSPTRKLHPSTMLGAKEMNPWLGLPFKGLHYAKTGMIQQD